MNWQVFFSKNNSLVPKNPWKYLKHPRESLPLIESHLKCEGNIQLPLGPEAPIQLSQASERIADSLQLFESTSEMTKQKEGPKPFHKCLKIDFENLKNRQKKPGPFLKITSSWFHFIKKINRAWPPRSGQQKKSNQSVAVKPAQPPWSSGKKFKKKKKKKCPLCPVWSDRFVRFDSNRSTVQPMKIEIRTPHCYWISSSSIVLHFVSMRRFCWKGRFFAVCFFAVGTLGLWSKKSNCVLQTHK